MKYDLKGHERSLLSLKSNFAIISMNNNIVKPWLLVLYRWNLVFIYLHTIIKLLTLTLSIFNITHYTIWCWIQNVHYLRTDWYIFLCFQLRITVWKQKRFYTRGTLTLKSQPFILIGSDPWSKKRGNYLSCTEGKWSSKDIHWSAQNAVLFVDLL